LLVFSNIILIFGLLTKHSVLLHRQSYVHDYFFFKAFITLQAEPVMYSCTVSVSKTISSKELDDLVMGDNFGNMKSREVEVADGVGDLGAGIGEPFEMFEKEDMSDMFKRAMLEKMQLVDEPAAKYKCLVCASMIQGRIITAMGNKFHPQCFVCTYCRKEFKDRKYKTDPRDCKPYCFGCFEKLLGHYGNAHG